MKKRILIILSTLFAILYLPTVSYAYMGELLVFVAPQSMDFHLEDPVGNISGYTPNGNIFQIPNISIYEKTSETTVGDEVLGEYAKFNELSPSIIPTNITTGKYKLVLYGSIKPINTLISIRSLWDNNIQWKMKYRNYQLIYPNTIWTYEFDVPTTPPANGQITLTKVSNPTDLIKDLTTAGQLGYIGNAKFIAELVKDINEIEAEKAKGKIDDGLTPAQKAKKEYTELLNEITEKYNKPESNEFVKQEAYAVLKEDLEYIIGHIQ